MTTIEQFNEILGVWKSPPGSPVVVAIGEGRESVYSLREKPGKGVDMFRVMIDDGAYDHVALVDNGHVMAIWHAQSATAAQDAPTGATQWTAAELAAYSEDNPYPPYKPGATADDTLASYEYEIAALKKQLADVKAELVTFAIIIHQCVGLSELMLVGYDTENGNALLKRAETLAEPVEAE